MNRLSLQLSLILVTSLAASSALAQPGGAPIAAGPPTVPGQPVAPGDAAPPVDDFSGVKNDAASTGMWFAPTALVNPKGTWTFESNELVLMGLGYSFADNFSISAHTLVPLGQDFLPIAANAKLALVDSGQLRVALTGNLLAVLGDGYSENVFGMGGVASLCLDEQCNSLINGYVGAYGLASSDANTSVPLVFSLGIAQRMSENVKFLAEIDGGAVLGEYDEVADGVLAWYGLRFHNEKMGVNVGFVKPVGAGDDFDDELPMGLPWLTFIYRGNP